VLEIEAIVAEKL